MLGRIGVFSDVTRIFDGGYTAKHKLDVRPKVRRRFLKSVQDDVFHAYNKHARRNIYIYIYKLKSKCLTLLINTQSFTSYHDHLLITL